MAYTSPFSSPYAASSATPSGVPLAYLQSSLRTDAWDGGPALNSLYSHLLVQLVRANVDRDVTKTLHCLDLVDGLAEAWRQAALQTAATA